MLIAPGTRLTVSVETSGLFDAAAATLGRLAGNRWVETVQTWTDSLPARAGVIRVSDVLVRPSATDPATATFAARTATSGGSRDLAQLLQEFRASSPPGVVVAAVTVSTATGQAAQAAEVEAVATEATAAKMSRGGILSRIESLLGRTATAALLIAIAVSGTVLVVRFARRRT